MSDSKWVRRDSTGYVEGLEPRAWWAIFLGICLFFILLIGGCSGFDSTDAGQVGVVRGASPFRNKVRQIMSPASGLSWVGVFSHVHKYPANQRHYTISLKSNEGDVKGTDRLIVPTSNGVPVGVEGTLYFNMNLDSKVLASFDQRFGTRTFGGLHPYDGGNGWENFLNQQIRPIIDNDLRQVLASIPCEDINASCALIQNQGGVQQVSNKQGVKSIQTVTQVQTQVDNQFKTDLQQQLGGEYLTNVHFVFRGVDLDQSILDKVNQALGAFAGVSEAQARLQQAQKDAQANEARQKGYQACPACAQIDTLKAIPGNVTTFAPGAGFAVTPPQK